MMARNLFLLLSLSYAKAALGFLPAWMPGAVLSSTPELARYTRGQTDTVLDVRLSVGLTSDKLFVVDGLQFQLCNVPMAKGDSSVPLPGAHGPRPHLSSGILAVDVMKDGSFINMEGMQTVDLQNGCWEMIWRDEAPAGVIICGFSLDKDARRNDSSLEKGQLYFSWPVWSKEGLEEQQARKAKAEERYREFEMERDNELEMMGNTPNILRKAMHFRNAAHATEKMDFTNLHEMMDIPSTDDVVEIGEGLHVVRSGTMWSKEDGSSFAGSFRASRQRLLGTATIR